MGKTEDREDYEERLREGLARHPRVCAVIDLSALLHDLKAMRGRIPGDEPICAVVKADGYGMGAARIARYLEEAEGIQLWGYAVATAEEAMELREAGVRRPILVLSYTFPVDYDRLLEADVRLAVFRRDMLHELAQRIERAQARGISLQARVHVAVDCGMSRIGVRPDDEGLEFIGEVLRTPGVTLEGIFTHFARADEADLSDARWRLRMFRDFVDRACGELSIDRSGIICHCANSAATLALPEAHMDMVRAGVTMYGMWPSGEMDRSLADIRPVLSLYSHVTMVKSIDKGTPVSYGGTFVAPGPMRIATIPVGYGDGYPRSLSGCGEVLIRGQRVRIIGRVCMDQFMVDVTAHPEIEEGDRVTLIGTDGDESITIEELGDVSGRFNYELSCDLNQRVPRIYLG